MTTVLVVEDDAHKARQLERFLRDAITGLEFTTARSFNSALRSLLDRQFDWVILDMSIPSFDEGGGTRGNPFRYFGGREILWEAKRRGLAMRAVVFTQFESFGEGEDAIGLVQLAKELRDEFGERFAGYVVYRANETSWQERLRVLLADGRC